MAKKVEAFRSNAGTIFNNEHDATCDDLRAWFTDTKVVNDAMAIGLVNFIANDLAKLIEFDNMVGAILKSHPANPHTVDQCPPIATPFEEWKKGQEPLVKLHVPGCVLGPMHTGECQLNAETKPNVADFSYVGTNSGHGHVWKRPDGVKARCGGPSICAICQNEQKLVSMGPPPPPKFCQHDHNGPNSSCSVCGATYDPRVHAWKRPQIEGFGGTEIAPR